MKAVLLLFVIGYSLMAAQIKTIQIKGVEIPVIFEKENRLPLVNMQIVFTNSGSLSDKNKPGLAKLSARVMNEGTKTEGSIDFAQKLESKAIHIASATGKETFVVEMSALKEYVAQASTYMQELFADPNLSEKTLQKVQSLTLGKIVQKQNDFDYIASMELKKILFPNTPLAQPALGTQESIATITLDDVQSFLKKHLVLRRAIVVVGGDISFKKLKKYLQTILEPLEVGTQEPLQHYNAITTPEESIVHKPTQQAYIYFGSAYNMAVNDPNYYKARVATFILGTGGFGSRLMEEIRVKRGLAYSAYARVDISKSVSYFHGYLQTKLASQKEAQQTVQEVIATFVKNGVTQEELDQTKRFLLGSEPLRVETMNQRLQKTFMDYYKGFSLDHSKEELKKIEKLTLDDLNDFIKQHQEILQLSFAIVTQ